MGVSLPARAARLGEAQVGGFATRSDALKALEKVLARLGPGGRAAAITLAELVEEYLEYYQAERVTIVKLRWLLGKATAMVRVPIGGGRSSSPNRDRRPAARRSGKIPSG